jgi:hypothetical protein
VVINDLIQQDVSALRMTLTAISHWVFNKSAQLCVKLCGIKNLTEENKFYLGINT